MLPTSSLQFFMIGKKDDRNSIPKFSILFFNFHFFNHHSLHLIHVIYQVARRRIRNKPGGGSSVAPSKDKVAASRNVITMAPKINNLTIDTSGTNVATGIGEGEDGHSVNISTIERLKRRILFKNGPTSVTRSHESTDDGPRSPPGIKVQGPSTSDVQSNSGSQSYIQQQQLSPVEKNFESVNSNEDSQQQLQVPGSSHSNTDNVQVSIVDGDKISIVSSESKNDAAKNNGASKNKNGSKKSKKTSSDPKDVIPKAPKSKTDIAKEKERKTARILGIITGCFLVCWLPFFLITTINTLSKEYEVTNPVTLSVLLWLGYCNSMLNPIIYTIFSPDFRSAFKKMVECKNRSGYN